MVVQVYLCNQGCGKSTLLKLLFRFHDPQSGRILIDDQDIKTISLNSLRKSIGVVPQDTILFNQSIRENILYGDPKASMNSIHQAAKMSNIHDLIISLPNQYESQVGERGMIISGGEKQRINLARVFLKSPSIILFDEPTSSLDTNTETQIMSSIYDFFDGKRTGVFIAHRLTTIMNCDLIIVLDKGTVVEIGSHDSLVAIDDGYYSRLWNSQQYMEDESDDDKTLE